MSTTLTASPRTVKVVAAVAAGLGIGSLVPPDPVAVPFVGPVSGVLVGATGIGTGALLYLGVADRVAEPECGCSGDCGC